MNENKQITILVAPHDGPTRVETMPHTLGHLQAIVGGNIETFETGIAGTIGVCNEEHLLLGLPRNRWCSELGRPMWGHFFVAGDAPSSFGSLTDEQIADLRAIFDA